MKISCLSIILLFHCIIINAQSTIPCDTSLWQHVYHKYRLEVKEECKTVSGVVLAKKIEADGDYHIRLKLDPGQGQLLNEKNISVQDSCLVIEAVCAHEVTQTDAISACENYVNNVRIPEVGEHIRVTGSYVLDTQHGWLEIHPITAIIVLGKVDVSPAIKTRSANTSSLTQVAYICSGSSQVYHINSGCSGLSHCTHAIIKTTQDSAISYYHRRLCKICGKQP